MRDRSAIFSISSLPERIVLLYSPSGAGKTSLVQAALMPAMEREGYRTRPIMRVSLELPRIDCDPGKCNRYILSCMISLEEELPPEERTPVRDLAAMTLAEYLGAKPSDELIVFDQFEEVLTIDPLNRAAKEEFFAQLGVALRPRGRWALFCMREDYVGALDPYLRPIPTRLGNTYRLDLLDVECALLAIQQPALAAGVPLTDEAARKLVDDLRTAQVQLPDGTLEQQPGQHLEPVQLQVVCRRLWDRLPEGTTLIAAEQVGAGGDINSALAGYYSDSIRRIAAETGISERAIRNWFQHGLITAQGIRGQVLQGAEESHGLSNRAVWPLVGTHLVRAEKRLGANWFELAHDRLIAPVRTDNAAWFESNLSVLQRQAALWEDQRHPEGLLLRGAPLQDAERWAASHPGLTPVETEFLAACRKLRATLRRQHLSQRLIQVLAVAACICTLVAGYFWWDARKLAHLTIAGVAASEAQRIKDEHFDRAILLNMAALDIAEEAAKGANRNRAVQLAEETAANLRDDIRLLLRKDDLQGWWIRPSSFLWGSGQEVTALAYRPDGAVLAAGSRGGEIMFWDIASHKSVCRTDLRLNGAAAALAFSPDGNFLAAATEDGAVSVIDASGLARAVCPHNMTPLKIGHNPGRIEGILFAQRRIAAYGARRIVIWDRERPREPEAILAAPQGGRFEAFPDPASGSIVVYNRQGQFRYDPEQRNLIAIPGSRSLTGHDATDAATDAATGAAAAFTPSGEPIVTGNSPRSLTVYSSNGPKMCAIDWVGRVVVAPNGKRLAVGTRDLQVAVCDLTRCNGEDNRTGAAACAVKTFSGANDSQVLAFHPSSVQMASSGPDGAIVVWNPERNSALMADVGEMAVLTNVRFLPDGEGMIRLSANHQLSFQSGLRTNPVIISTAATRFALTEDGREIAFAEQPPGEPETVQLRELGHDGSARSWKPDRPVLQLFAAADRIVAVVEARAPHKGLETRIVTWNSSAPQAPPSVSNGPEIPERALFEVSPHGAWLAHSGNGLNLFDLRAGTSRRLDVSAPVTGVAFGGERFLAVKTAAPALELWDVRGNRLAIRAGEFGRMAAGPEGLLAAVSMQTFEISVWRKPSQEEEPRILRYHDLPVEHLTLNPGVHTNATSRYLLSADSAWTALWDLESPDLLTEQPTPLPIRIREKSNPVLSPDGKYVAGEFLSETPGMRPDLRDRRQLLERQRLRHCRPHLFTPGMGRQLSGHRLRSRQPALQNHAAAARSHSDRSAVE